MKTYFTIIILLFHIILFTESYKPILNIDAGIEYYIGINSPYDSYTAKYASIDMFFIPKDDYFTQTS